MIAERRMVVRYFVSRTVPGLARDEDFEPGISVQRKGFSNLPTALLWVARGSLFMARNQRCYCKRLENEHKGEPAWDGGPRQCKYCDREQWEPIVKRLARILLFHHKKDSKP